MAIQLDSYKGIAYKSAAYKGTAFFWRKKP